MHALFPNGGLYRCGWKHGSDAVVSFYTSDFFYEIVRAFDVAKAV
jgi:hypothetical protein